VKKGRIWTYRVVTEPDLRDVESEEVCHYEGESLALARASKRAHPGSVIEEWSEVRDEYDALDFRVQEVL
jgi:hypothetical protein